MTISSTSTKEVSSSAAVIDKDLWTKRPLENVTGISNNYIVFDNEELKINFANYKRVFLLHKHISLFKKNSLRQAKKVNI